MSEIPVIPTGHYVLVKPDRFEKTTESGLVIATDYEANREDVAAVKGTLVAIGPQAWLAFGDEPWAEVGQKVYFKRHVSDQIFDNTDLVDGKPQRYFLMQDENILGVIPDGK